MAFTDAPAIDNTVAAAVNRALPDVVTIPELAAALQLSVHGVRNMIDRGEVPGVIRVGRRIRISRRVAERWLNGDVSAA